MMLTRESVRGFQGAQLLAVKLTCANLENASLRNCNFEDPHLQPAALEGANLRGANLEGSQVRVFVFKNFSQKLARLLNFRCLGLS